jgi:hypothetical protein
LKLGGKDKQEILAEMAGMDKPTFSPATKFPTYAEFQSGRLEKSENKNDHYGFHPDPLQGFTVANRTSAAKPNDQSEPDSKSEPDNKFEGQKIHISVDPAKAKEAYEALAPLLFSADSPIDRFKMTDMGEAQAAGTDEANRVSQGAQFTIYLKPDPKQNEFNASHLNKIHSFVGKVTENLQQSGVGPGTRPSSDAELPGDYASFRNEKLAESNDKESAEKSKQDPVYQILNPQNPLNP